MGFPQIPLFWFDLANLALAREWQGSRSGTLTRARVLPLPLRPALTFPCGPWRPAGTSSRPRECGLLPSRPLWPGGGRGASSTPELRLTRVSRVVTVGNAEARVRTGDPHDMTAPAPRKEEVAPRLAGGSYRRTLPIMSHAAPSLAPRAPAESRARPSPAIPGPRGPGPHASDITSHRGPAKSAAFPAFLPCRALLLLAQGRERVSCAVRTVGRERCFW